MSTPDPHAPPPPAHDPHAMATEAPPSRVRATIQALKQGVGALVGLLKELAQDLRAPDRATRRMALLFWVSLVLALILGSVVAVLTWRAHHSGPAHVEVSLEPHGFLKHKPPSVEFDRLFFSLKKPLKTRRHSKTMFPRVELQLVIECETTDACEEIGPRKVVIRDALVKKLTGESAERFLDLEARKALTDELKELLQELVPSARIQEVYWIELRVE